MKTQVIIKKLDAWFVTGFSDGEASFIVSITENKKLNTGWKVQLMFSIKLHLKDKLLLEQIRNFWNGVGNIEVKDNSCVFVVYSLDQLRDVIIPHFEKYPLLTQKFADFTLFKEIAHKVFLKEHLTLTGLEAIISKKIAMNLGYLQEEKFKDIFPNINNLKTERPLINTMEIPHPQWMAGFVSAEGCFFVKIAKSNTAKLGIRTELVFIVTQHIRDSLLLNLFINYFGCGKCYISKRESLDYRVFSFSDIFNRIIPFFTEHNIRGEKVKDFDDFCLVANLIKDKSHLTSEGLDRIRVIKANMRSS